MSTHSTPQSNTSIHRQDQINKTMDALLEEMPEIGDVSNRPDIFEDMFPPNQLAAPHASDEDEEQLKHSARSKALKKRKRIISDDEESPMKPPTKPKLAPKIKPAPLRKSVLIKPPPTKLKTTTNPKTGNEMIVIGDSDESPQPKARTTPKTKIAFTPIKRSVEQPKKVIKPTLSGSTASTKPVEDPIDEPSPKSDVPSITLARTPIPKRFDRLQHSDHSKPLSYLQRIDALNKQKAKEDKSPATTPTPTDLPTFNTATQEFFWELSTTHGLDPAQSTAIAKLFQSKLEKYSPIARQEEVNQLNITIKDQQKKISTLSIKVETKDDVIALLSDQLTVKEREIQTLKSSQETASQIQAIQGVLDFTTRVFDEITDTALDMVSNLTDAIKLHVVEQAREHGIALDHLAEDQAKRLNDFNGSAQDLKAIATHVLDEVSGRASQALELMITSGTLDLAEMLKRFNSEIKQAKEAVLGNISTPVDQE